MKKEDLVVTSPIRNDPTGFFPWTVSVAVMPGTPPCPALERLDKALKKTRGAEDPDITALKEGIVWPQEYLTKMFFVTPYPQTALDKSFRQWEEYMVSMITSLQIKDQNHG